jgi:hypothetical protein
MHTHAAQQPTANWQQQPTQTDNDEGRRGVMASGAKTTTTNRVSAMSTKRAIALLDFPTFSSDFATARCQFFFLLPQRVVVVVRVLLGAVAIVV